MSASLAGPNHFRDSMLAEAGSLRRARCNPLLRNSRQIFVPIRIPTLVALPPVSRNLSELRIIWRQKPSLVCGAMMLQLIGYVVIFLTCLHHRLISVCDSGRWASSPTSFYMDCRRSMPILRRGFLKTSSRVILNGMKNGSNTLPKLVTSCRR